MPKKSIANAWQWLTGGTNKKIQYRPLRDYANLSNDGDDGDDDALLQIN
jgi:hypothetical protein